MAEQTPVPIKTHNSTKKKGRSRLLKYAVTAAGALAIFWVGVLVGNGRIAIGPDAVFRKPVAKNLPDDLNYASVEQVYDSLRKSFDGQLDVNELLDGLKQGLARASDDPYTEYFNADQAKEFHEQITGSFTGIGAVLSKDQDGNLIVVSPIAGFPAEKAGLKARDLIAEVDGSSTTNMAIDEAVSRIRGPKDTKVTLKVVRNNSQALSFTIIRDDIKVPSVETKTLDGNIGYIQVTQFSDDTAQLVRDAASKFKQAGVKGMVLDLRGNPGGRLEAAVQISNLWLDSGKTILTERRGDTVVKTYDAIGSPLLKAMPTVVLIDEGSASASEIVAGALRDNNVARIIGVKSFGKGSVQDLICFEGRRASNGDCLGPTLKVTIAHWYTPGGKNIDKQGVAPDQEVKRSDQDIQAERDPQLDAAVSELNR